MLNPWKYFVITGKITIVNLSVTINTLHNLYQLKLCDLSGFISLNIFRWKQSYRETFTKANWAKWMWASVPGLGQPVESNYAKLSCCKVTAPRPPTVTPHTISHWASPTVWLPTRTTYLVSCSHKMSTYSTLLVATGCPGDQQYIYDCKNKTDHFARGDCSVSTSLLFTRCFHLEESDFTQTWMSERFSLYRCKT